MQLKDSPNRGVRFKDLTGMVFGQLTVIETRGIGSNPKVRNYKWLCKCTCGGETVSFSTNLLRGIATSCGCHKRSILGKNTTTHGLSGTRIFKIWTGMRKRCLNPKCKAYPLYGGRGITISDEWKNSFETFFNDMGLKPSKLHSIDRYPNKKGNYEPGNCRWATTVQQNRNRKDNVLYTYLNQTKTIPEWAEELGIKSCTLKNHIVRGKSFKEAFEYFNLKKQ